MSAPNSFDHPTSSWPSRSSSTLSEAALTVNTSASALSSLSNNWFTPLQPHPHGAVTTTEAVPESPAGAVPPLLGLQRLAGNAFSLRQISVLWTSPSTTAVTATTAVSAATQIPGPGVHLSRGQHSPRWPTQPTAHEQERTAAGATAASAATATGGTTAAEAASIAYITPNTSPRTGWPAWTPQLPSGTMPREPRSGSAGHPGQAPQALQQHQQERQFTQHQPGQLGQFVPLYANGLSCTSPVPTWRQRRCTALSARVPAAGNGSSLYAQSQSCEVHEVPSYSASSPPVGAHRNVEAPFGPPFQPKRHNVDKMSAGVACQHAQSYDFGTHAPFSDTVRSNPGASVATPLQAPARQPPWRSVGQPPLLSQAEGAAPYAVCDGMSYNGTLIRQSPPLSSVSHQYNGAIQDSAALALVSSQPTSTAALRHLFQQYIEAQRTLEPVLQQLRVPSHKYFPLALQEAVLEQVQLFAAQLERNTHPFTTVSTQGDPVQPKSRRSSNSAAAMEAFGGEVEEGRRRGSTPRPREVFRRSEDICWDAILPFLPAPPPAGAHATLRAVAPGLRRRLEQHAWSWLIEEVRTTVCPFVVENGVEAHVRDAYARLDGRERQYVGSVPVARRTPALVPRHETTPEERRLLDGTVLLDCERQSLLLDRAWREGWLHRCSSSHLRFLNLLFTCHRSPRFLRLNPSRIHVDGVVCDVLRPRRNQNSSGAGTNNNATSVAAAAAGAGSSGAGGTSVSVGMEEINANTVPRADLTPLPPPMLDGRPAAALSVTRKLLGDAVSAISRERARSADVATRVQLSRRLISTGATSTTAAQMLVESPRAMEGGAHPDFKKGGGGSSQRGPSPPPPPKPTPTLLQRHPYFCHESLPVIMEDVNGTAHVFCTRRTAMHSAAVRGLMCGWLQRRHRMRRQPVYTSAAEFLLVGYARRKKKRAIATCGDTDYVICTDTPSTAELMAALHDRATGAATPTETWRLSPRVRHGAVNEGEAPATSRTDEGDDVPCDNGDAEKENYGDDVCPVLLHDDEQLGCIGVSGGGGGFAENPRRTAAQRLFHARLQEWRIKREDVVRRMNGLDPSWLMLGNSRGPQPRPLALHLTEQHLPWLAAQLCPDSDSGGLADLQALHLCVAELRLTADWVPAWQWCLSVLRSRQNLLVVSIVAAVEPPPMALEAVSVDSGDEPVAAVSALQGLVNPIEPVTGPASALFIAAVLEIPSVQVLDLHGITGEGAMLLFQAAPPAADENRVPPKSTPSCAAGDKAGTHVSQYARLARLRDLYVTVRRGHGAGASPRSSYSGEICLSAVVFPSLQVLWLDAPRLRRFTFDKFLVLRELHLVSDSALLCSSLRGIETLPYLEVLHVERAVIDDCAFMGDCPALRELMLHACRLSLALLAASAEGDATATGGGGPVEELCGVERAPNLETLSLCYTEEIKQLSNFSRCRSLRRVLLTRCNGVSSGAIAGFERLPCLEVLALEYTRVSGLSHLAKAPALRTLRVDGCKRVLRSSVMGLEMAPHLTELSLQDTNVSTVANFGGGCTALQSLDLSGCRHLDVDGLQGIQALPQLEVLSLSHTPITEVNFLADCLQLTTLYVEGCTELMPTALEELRSAPMLRKIVANGCTSISAVGQLGRCRLLEVLSVSGAAALETAGAQGIERSARLRFLDLSGTSVHSLRFLARGCRGLRYLSVRGCTRLVDIRELHGVEELPHLQTFNMENLSVSGSLDFVTLSTSLLYVSFSGCTGLTEADVRALRGSHISITIP
ncbi:hypothetical protein NQL31_007918 [Lotmaria passim]